MRFLEVTRVTAGHPCEDENDLGFGEDPL